MAILDRFGLYTGDDVRSFATLTGRADGIFRAIRNYLLKRRREAYLTLRRVLPMEVAAKITNEMA